jgi:hypothetical protein
MTDSNIKEFKDRFVAAFNRAIHDKSLAQIINRFHDRVFKSNGIDFDELAKFKKQYPSEFELIERKCNTFFY